MKRKTTIVAIIIIIAIVCVTFFLGRNKKEKADINIKLAKYELVDEKEAPDLLLIDYIKAYTGKRTVNEITFNDIGTLGKISNKDILDLMEKREKNADKQVGNSETIYLSSGINKGNIYVITDDSSKTYRDLIEDGQWGVTDYSSKGAISGMDDVSLSAGIIDYEPNNPSHDNKENAYKAIRAIMEKLGKPDRAYVVYKDITDRDGNDYKEYGIEEYNAIVELQWDYGDYIVPVIIDITEIFGNYPQERAFNCTYERKAYIAKKDVYEWTVYNCKSPINKEDGYKAVLYKFD